MWRDLSLIPALVIIAFPHAAFAAPLSYNRDIRPILSDKCFACYGPDAAKRQAGLRLDIRESAFADGAIVPRNPDQSEVIARIQSHDSGEQMPPPKSKLGRLFAKEIASIRQWIAQGAKYESYWAFIPLKIAKAAPPKAKSVPLALDSLVWSQLKRRNLKPQPQASRQTLICNLKQRGMLDDTLVVWGGEFGRTNYCQGKTQTNFGRDHHPRCFSMWMAGGGLKPGLVYGETDELGYNIAENGVHVHDFHATLLHLLGIDHERLTYKFQGRRYRLTDVHGCVVKDIVA